MVTKYLVGLIFLLRILFKLTIHGRCFSWSDKTSAFLSRNLSSQPIAAHEKKRLRRHRCESKREFLRRAGNGMPLQGTATLMSKRRLKAIDVFERDVNVRERKNQERPVRSFRSHKFGSSRPEQRPALRKINGTWCYSFPTNSLKFSTEEIMCAQNFNFVPISSFPYGNFWTQVLYFWK